MQKHKLFSRIISAALSVTTASQLLMSALPASVFAAALNTDYVIYSDEDVTINTYKAVLNGNIFSGDDFTYLGTDTCYVNKSLNADKKTGNISARETVDARTAKPDYKNQLKNGVNYNTVYSGDHVMNASEFDLHGSLYTKGKLRIDRTKFTGKGYIRAKNSINYNAVQNDENSEIFLYSEKGNITLQGADLTINGILYAPEGTVELNAKNLTLNGTIVAKNVEFNGTNLTVNEIRDKSTSLIQFGPDLEIKGIEDTVKENRRISLDISESFGIGDIDTDSLSWSFTADNGAGADCIKIDESTSTNLVKNLIITKQGIYRVNITGKDKDGNEIRYYDIIEVVEDIAPVAGFYIESDKAIRDENGVAEIVLEDTSYSLDGDTIGSRVWSVFFDSDNDGDFSDETERVFSTGNETKVTFYANSVGNYRFRLCAAEVIEDTIQSLISDDAYKIGTTDNVKAELTDVEVLNTAPESYSGVSKAKNVDIVVTVGNADISDIDTLNRNISSIQKDLESKGYSVNLSTVSTSTLTAKDTFAWEEYDHYEYQDSYGQKLPQHIVYEEDSIKMLGYFWAPLRDWLFVDDGIQAKRILSFDMVRDRTDWHSMEGGGFLFNTSIRDEIQPAEDESEETTVIKRMDGYCILLTNGGFKLVQFNDLDAESFRNGGVSSLMQTAGTVLLSVPVANVYDNYNVRIVASNRILSVYINDEPLIDNFVLPDTDTGTGFGPIICHSSHGCSQQSYFTFSNIKMTTVNGSELSDVLDKFKWRDSAKHYVLNLSKQSVFDLNNEESVGSAVKSLIEKKTDFIGLGTAASKDQYSLLLKSADGVYMDWYDVLKNEDMLRNFILNDLRGIDYSISDNLVTTSDEIVYEDYFVDRENDPVGDQVWEYDLDSTIYENSSRKSGVFVSEKPLGTLEATGLYKIQSKLRDDPTNGNTALEPYQKWSNKVEWTKGLYVHSLPTASVSSKIYSTDDPNKFLTELTFEAQDVDGLSHKNSGIAEERFEWKCIDDSDWQEGKVPSSIKPEKIYIQKYTVRDEQGAWSIPSIELLFAEKSMNDQKFEDSIDPVAVLTVSDENPSVGDEILISVSATDNTEVAYVRTTVNGELVSAYQGSVIYSCDKEGELEIKTECADIAGNIVTVTKTVSVTDRRDLTAPQITVDPDADVKLTDKTITVSGYIYDDTAFDNYKAEYAVKGSEEFTLAAQSSTEVRGGTIASFDIPGEGVYTLKITASDKAGNTSYFTLDITVTETEISETVSEQTTELPEPATMPEYVDTPAVITIKASTEKAEVGDVVIVSADASDKDGLVSMKIFKDDALVAEAPSEFRFSEADAKIVTIRVETLDSKGGKSEKTLEIIIEDNRDKTPPTAEIISPEPGSDITGKVTVKGSAFDETGLRLYSLEYKKENEKLFTPISTSYSERRNTELGVWDTYALDNGIYELRLTVTDNGGNSVYFTAKYNVINGADVSEDQLTEDLIVITKPDPNIKADDKIKVEAAADPSLSGKEYEIIISGANGTNVVKEGTITSDGMLTAAVDSSMYPDGKYNITVAVKSIDAEGNDNSVTRDSTVIVKHDLVSVNGKYDCEITSPDDMDELTCKTDIHAKVTEYVFTRYKFEYSEASKNTYTIFSKGDVRNDTDIVGAFDTTVLENGYYDIRFTAYGDGIVAEDTITVNVTGNLKIGNFSISFDDIETEINGIPLTVTSTYDSRIRSSESALGYGWNIGYNNVKVSVSTNQFSGWTSASSSGGFISRYSIAETRKHRVRIDFGNGEYDEFAMKISPESQAFYPLQYGLSAYYVSTTGSGATLVPSDMSPNELIFNGGILYNDNFIEYNPNRFVYTATDGSAYVVDVVQGLVSVSTADGDNLLFTDRGIICSGKTVITYKHDAEDRIIEASTASGKVVSYDYDVFGDLVAVTDVSGNKKTFKYNKHYLTEVYTSDGTRVARNEYDDDGRLTKTIDADGSVITYTHDVDGREETVKDRNGGITRYFYDNAGNITSQIDPMGNTVKNTYNNDGKLTEKVDALGNKTSYKYDSDGNLVETADAEGIITSNSYNSTGLLQSVSVMGVVTNTYSYDGKGRIISKTDANGDAVKYGYSGSKLSSITDDIGSYVNITYGTNGKPLTSKAGDGTTCSYVYDEDGRCTSRTISYISNGEAKQSTINYTYDKAGRVISTVDSDGNVINTEYNAAGKPTVETDKNGNQTRYTYDKLGNLTRITYPDNTSESFTYDKNGNNITAVDRAGRTAAMAYDKAGNLVSKTYAGGVSMNYKYDANYRLIEQSCSDGSSTRYEYDKIGRNTAIIDALGNRTEYTYTTLSYLSSAKDANGNITKYTYDNKGNLIRTDFADGTSTSTEFNSRGLAASRTDQYGNKTAYTYDSMSRLTSVTDPMGGKTVYEYDEMGNLVKQTDANGNSAINEYDQFGRVIKVINAMGQSAEYTYDKNGNILSSSDFGGKVTSFTYDKNDRLTSKRTEGERAVTYRYSNDGKLVSVNDARGNTVYTYDSSDRLTKIAYPDSRAIEYAYNELGMNTAITTPTGITSYTYDALGRVSSVTDRNGNTTSYEYDAVSNRKSMRYADGITVTYTYNEMNRPVSETAVDASGSTVASYTYSYGKCGEVTHVKESARDVYYEYDAMMRLVSEKIVNADLSSETYAYTYDSVSNRTSKTVNGKKSVYTYNKLNQLTSGDGVTYSYDAAGNLVSEESAASASVYKYNSDNMLIEADVNGTVEEYKYDFAGNRISKMSENDSTYYLNDILSDSVTQVLEEYDTDGMLKAAYTRGVGLVSQQRGDAVTYYLSDAHDSVRQLADAEGTVTDTYSYDAWGNLLSKTGATENSYYYCGEQLDGTTGYYYLRARYMDPATGTFTTLDTYQGSQSDPITLNKYLYANANPVMYNDPTGHFGLLSIGASLLLAPIIGNIMSYFIKDTVYDLFANTFCDFGDGDPAEVSTDSSSFKLDTFEKFFNFNNLLITANFELTCVGMIMGACKLKIGEAINDADEMLEGARATIDGAMSLASAYQQRYDLYDFIFAYAMDEAGYMEEMSRFTVNNIRSLVSTVTGLIPFKGKFEKVAKVLIAAELYVGLLSGITDNDYKLTALDTYTAFRLVNAIIP